MRHELVGIKEVAGGWIKKYVLHYQMSNGKEFKYDLATRNNISSASDLAGKTNAVCIICYDNAKRFVLLKEFRYAVNDYVIAFPAGLVDEGESIEEAAKRELYEETGLSGDVVYSLNGGFSSEGMTDEKVAICMIKVEDVTKLTNQNVQDNEDINFMTCTVDELKSIVTRGEYKISNRVQVFVAGMSQLV
jgi:ADP-ribose pyrophosphatase